MHRHSTSWLNRAGARRHLARAIEYRLRWNVVLAQQQELMAWTMPDCTSFVFAQYHLKLAVRLAHEGRFSEANEMFERAERSGVLQDRIGYRMIATTRRVINVWRRASQLDPILA